VANHARDPAPRRSSPGFAAHRYRFSPLALYKLKRGLTEKGAAGDTSEEVPSCFTCVTSGVKAMMLFRHSIGGAEPRKSESWKLA